MLSTPPRLPKRRKQHHKFWEMHDMLYKHQDALDDQHLAEYATHQAYQRRRSSARWPNIAYLEPSSRGFHEWSTQWRQRHADFFH